MLGHLFAGQFDGLRVVARAIHVDGMFEFDRGLSEWFDVARSDEETDTWRCRGNENKEVGRSEQNLSAGSRSSLPARNKGIENMLPSSPHEAANAEIPGNPRLSSVRSFSSSGPQVATCKGQNTCMGMGFSCATIDDSKCFHHLSPLSCQFCLRRTRIESS